MLYLLPLLLAFGLLVPVALSPIDRRVKLALTQLALLAFGTYVTDESPRRDGQLALMRAAHVSDTYRAYAARTLLFAGLFGLVGSILGVYFAGFVLWLLSVRADALAAALPSGLTVLANLARLSELGAGPLFALLLFSGATLGVALAFGVYWLRWRHLEYLAEVRAEAIEASLPRTVAFTYALSRSGMPFPQVLRTLTRNQAVYGEAATEVSVAVRDMDAFGADVLTALRRMATRTPSDDLEEFSENLASVLASGRNLSAFLREQYERYQREAESLQQQYLELLSAFAEIYVTVLVAGPLFFITVLVIIGLVLRDTMLLLALVGYVGIPAGTAIFAYYLDDAVRGIGNAHSADDQHRGTDSMPTPLGKVARSDGGAVASARETCNRERLSVYDRLAPVRPWLREPVSTLLAAPTTVLAAVLPLSIGWFLLRIGSTGAENVLDLVVSPLIESTVIVLGSSAVVYELRKRRLDAIDEAVPDLLDRLASVNEAGLTVVASLKRVANSDLGALGPEVRRARTDIEWGASAETALRRLERRAETAMVSRSVTLVTNAMTASGEVAPVLRIAASEAQNSRRLRRERKQEMLTYLLVIYISFFVFLGIVAALSVAFIPAVESAAIRAPPSESGIASVGGVSSGVFSGLQSVNTAAYERLFFHVAAIQGVCSGLVAGQLGEGQIADGLKHATVLLASAYLVFAFI